MKNFILYLSILLIQFLTPAQTINTKIKLLDGENNLPVSNANISLSEIYFGTTNNEGEYIIENISKGNYLLLISHISYKTFESKIDLFSDTSITIILDPGNIKLDEVLVTSGKY